MATLLLTAVGTVVGGPLGGALGALAGRQIDSQLLGNGNGVEGPRLKDLQVSTSSYGQPIPRHFGRVRTAGTIIWATDLKETSESGGGGKGRPKTTSYSYSASFAIALSSRPIERVGKIWADGNLLSSDGSSVPGGGTIRLYRGFGDQPIDPLIKDAQGAQASAFRNIAYILFEDLQLADFGNRVPALTFELFADAAGVDGPAIADAVPDKVSSRTNFPNLLGFSHESGSVRGALATLDNVYPIACDIGAEGLVFENRRSQTSGTLPRLAEPASQSGTDNERDRMSRRSFDGDTQAPKGLRYYDLGRDYQPGLQRPVGRGARNTARIIEFPGTLAAKFAAILANEAALRGKARADTIAWKTAEIDPANGPGAIVQLPDRPGSWMIIDWEWNETGIDLELQRLAPTLAASAQSDPGSYAAPPEPGEWPTWFEAFELPWDGRGSGTDRKIYSASSAAGGGWAGASIYHAAGTDLQPIGRTDRRRSTVGTIATPVSSSPALLLENHAEIEVELLASDMVLGSSSERGLAMGANRILVGGEVMQFRDARQVADKRWILSGLLRGRGGTEAAAQGGHPVGTPIVLLDDAIELLDYAAPRTGETELFAAIGRHDAEPVYAPLRNADLSTKPLSPVHGRASSDADGTLSLSWTRRARGMWEWLDEVEVPLMESTESYRVGIGDPANPVAQWTVGAPYLKLSAEQMTDLRANRSGEAIWVRQIGIYAPSPPLKLATIGTSTP